MGRKGKLYTTGDVADLLGVTRQYAYSLTRRKGFPDSYDEWENGITVWRVPDVQAWLRENRPQLNAEET